MAEEVNIQQREEVAKYLGQSTTRDSFRNLQLQLGRGTANPLSEGSTYGFYPISRDRSRLEFMHRGSWLAGVAVDVPPADMTKMGIELTSGELSDQDKTDLHNEAIRLGIWASFRDALRWARLYGGSVAIIMIDGAAVETPLDLDKIGKGAFRGLLVLDRWAIYPSVELITELGPDLGKPEFYRVNQPMLPVYGGKNVHHSRVLRFEGVSLPPWQRASENGWGISVLERLYDRMVAFDSATQGGAQLLYKAYLRVMKIPGLRLAAATDTSAFAGIMNYMENLRYFQSNEGITAIDNNDDLSAMASPSFTGVGEMLTQLAQQVAGALETPLVRLFGMSPAGFSTGDTDLQNYYDRVEAWEERDLRGPVNRVYRVMGRSLRSPLDEDNSFTFRSLWQLSEDQKAASAAAVTGAAAQAVEGGLVSRATALRELAHQSRITGMWTTITADDIEEAESDAPPAPGELAGAGGATGKPLSPELEGGEGDQPEAETLGAAGGAGGGERSSSLRVVGSRDRAPYTELVPGLAVVIENPRGSTRYPYRTQLPAHYGHLRWTEGADGEEVDCYVGDRPADGHDVHAIWQVDPTTGVGNEWKLMLGFANRADALRAYQGAFDDGLGAARVGAVRRMGVAEVRTWLLTGGGRRAPEVA